MKWVILIGLRPGWHRDCGDRTTSRLNRYGAGDAPTDYCWMPRASVTFRLCIDEGNFDEPEAGGGDSRATTGRRIADTTAAAESAGRGEG
jgi:hypothetical protein